MASRTRNNSAVSNIGTWSRYGQTYGNTNTTIYTETCDDVTGPGDNDYFLVSRNEYVGGRINTIGPWNYYEAWFSNYLAEAMQYKSVFTPITTYPGQKTDAYYATSAAARTTPSRPYVDVPVALFELGDICRLLNLIGRKNLGKDIGRTNLAYHFGIAPLVGDLVKLISFQEQVDRRVKEIMRLQGATGFRKTVKLDELVVNDSKSIVMQSQGHNFTLNVARSGTRLIRGHCRWKPTQNLSGLSQAEMSALAKRAVLGMTIDFSTGWELMPWSWLIDWGSNIGAFFAANRNIIPAVLSSTRLITHTRTVYQQTSSVTHSNYWRLNPFRVSLETKERKAVSIAPTAHFPFLSGKQLGILGSLAIVKAKY